MTASSSILHIAKRTKAIIDIDCHRMQFFFWDQAKAKLWKTHSKLKGSISLEKEWDTMIWHCRSTCEVAHKSMKDMNWTWIDSSFCVGAYKTPLIFNLKILQEWLSSHEGTNVVQFAGWLNYMRHSNEWMNEWMNGTVFYSTNSMFLWNIHIPGFNSCTILSHSTKATMS